MIVATSGGKLRSPAPLGRPKNATSAVMPNNVQTQLQDVGTAVLKVVKATPCKNVLPWCIEECCHQNRLSNPSHTLPRV
eukprot:m.460951 g.460951  ORF g.460951 m.460951 type:complete len:79 (-) comp22176_c0_seq1:167-403(-)